MDAAAIGTVLDPVWRTHIRHTEAAATATLDGGRRFYFCTESCYEAFLDLPHSYVGWNASRNRKARGHSLRSVRRVLPGDRSR